MAGSDLFTGTLDLLILKALQGERLHGYAIGEWIRETSQGLLPVEQGALYPALRRVGELGFASWTWGTTDTGRKAKVYRLTAQGKAHLAEELERWEKHSKGMRFVLKA